MNNISSRKIDEVVCPPANDNHISDPNGFSILDILSSEDDFTDIAKRTERLGVVVVIGIAVCWLLVATIAFFLALR